jgi:hypothetical protein
MVTFVVLHFEMRVGECVDDVGRPGKLRTGRRATNFVSI